MPALNQETRRARLVTPLGDDVLVISHFTVREGISEMFEISAECLSEQGQINFDACLGLGCTISYLTFDDVQRHFHGIMVRAASHGKHRGLHRYTIVLRPWPHLLTHAADCRIFETMKVTDIVRQVFTQAGFNDFRFDVTGEDPELEYCVQYRETHANFACRLLEHHGMFYYFEHERAKHTLVVADARSSLRVVPELVTIPYTSTDHDRARLGQHLDAWTPLRHFRTGKAALNEYDFKRPNASMLAESDKAGAHARSALEIYDYPGGYEKGNTGEALARARAEEFQSPDKRREVGGDAASLYPGGLITVVDHPDEAENQQYLVVRATHSVSADSYTSDQASDETIYTGSYELQPADRPFRAPLVTPKPLIHGVQTARVIGSNGGTLGIDVDEFGRILVEFHWDRENGKSRRVRVGQMWADRQWGSVYTPRIGQEVIVTHLEGDPDQPLVIGAVYNGDNRHPYPMPDQKTWSGIKSRTVRFSKGYNEFVFDDGDSGPLLRTYADKDQEAGVGNDEKRTIARDQKNDVGRNQDDTIGDTLTITAGTKIILKVGGSTITMDGTSITVESLNITIKGNATLDASSPLTTVSGDGTLTLKGGIVLIN
jgi:type VI secretion system secreted protein VgrG